MKLYIVVGVQSVPFTREFGEKALMLPNPPNHPDNHPPG
jgi:hypothetical protein